MSHSGAFGDKYTMAAAKRFGVKPEKVTKEQRRVVKLDLYREAFGIKNEQAPSKTK